MAEENLRTTLSGLEISENMIEMAEKNAAEYGITDRVFYVLDNSNISDMEELSRGSLSA